MRYLTAGESHGPQLTGIVDGIPAGLPLSEEYIAHQLARRQEGYGRGGRMAFEKDQATITSGLRHGLTMGGPIAFTVENRAFVTDKANWPMVMSKIPVDEEFEKITLPRPGHADLVGALKYGFDDIRPVIERSSARETTTRVACGAIARRFLEEFGIHIGGHVTRIGSIGYNNYDEIRAAADVHATNGANVLGAKADDSEVRCIDESLSAQMVDEIKICRKEGLSLGGHWEIVITGVPAGLGSFTHWDKKLDGLIAHAVLGTQAMKGVEFGQGFESGYLMGNRVHDEIILNNNSFSRATNRSGGFEGGMTTGMPLIIRGIMKPIPTMLNPLGTVDIVSKTSQPTRYERSDVCALPRAIVVLENVIAPVIANALIDKIGGDSISEMKNRFNAL
ncbi:chorismate synthase [bacterium]|nr:MAG: chorismate synthase [bacterium]